MNFDDLLMVTEKIPNEEIFFLRENEPANRKQVRALFFDVNLFAPQLLKIENDFYEELLVSDRPYTEIYFEYKERWLKLCKQTAQNKKVKLSMPNFEFFDKHFFPEEKEVSREITFGP